MSARTEPRLPGVTQGRLVEEPSHVGAEIIENSGKYQFLLSCERSRRVVRTEDLGDLRSGIKNNHDQNAGIQVFRNFVWDLTLTIRRRAYLDDELGHFGPISRR
jgi:hypothetical protein